MTNSLLETLSTIADPIQQLETQAPQQSDWLMPAIKREPIISTDAEGLEHGPTVGSEPTKFTSPIRRSSLGVYVDGNRVKILQQWECVVINVHDDVVSCEMLDLTNENCPNEYAEVYLTEFSEFDRPLLFEGTVFYWSVGHFRRATGQIVRNSEIRVRRMPKLSTRKKTQIARKVARLRELINRD